MYDKNNQINNLQNTLNNTYNQLNNEINSKNGIQNELNNTHNQLNNEINSKNEIQNELNKYKDMVSQRDLKINSLENQINDLLAKNQYSNNKIVNLMDEIKQLNLIIKATKGHDKLKEPISINFRSSHLIGDAKIVCYYHETLSQVEEKLYIGNPSLRNANNIFLYDGKNLDKNKTLLSNEIIDGAIISVHENSFI